jgi:hypothetical protein
LILISLTFTSWNKIYGIKLIEANLALIDFVGFFREEGGRREGREGEERETGGAREEGEKRGRAEEEKLGSEGSAGIYLQNFNFNYFFFDTCADHEPV